MRCWCNYKSNIRTDCIHYHCEHDMGASIDCCTLKGLGNCPCTNDCSDYVDKAEVYRLGLEALKQPNSQPTIEPQQQWIPCAERLPKQNGVYIVTRNISDGFEYNGITDCCYFDGSNTWHDDTRVNHGREYLTDVIAWQPLPESYREGEEC